MPKRNKFVNDKEQHILVVNFKDGEKAELPWAMLRDACPCAECKQKHGTQQDNPLQLTVAPNTTLVGVEFAGNYAIVLIWGDGHNTGIFSWNYLRGLAARLQSSTDK